MVLFLFIFIYFLWVWQTQSPLLKTLWTFGSGKKVMQVCMYLFVYLLTSFIWLICLSELFSILLCSPDDPSRLPGSFLIWPALNESVSSSWWPDDCLCRITSCMGLLGQRIKLRPRCSSLRERGSSFLSAVCVCMFTVARDGWRYICLRHLIASVSLFALVLFLSSDLLPSVITAKILILTHILQPLAGPGAANIPHGTFKRCLDPDKFGLKMVVTPRLHMEKIELININ